MQEGNTALLMIVANEIRGGKAIVELLLQNGADPNVKNRVSACWLAALLDLIWCNMLLCVAGECRRERLRS